MQCCQIEDAGGDSKFGAYLAGLKGRKGFHQLRKVVIVAHNDDRPERSFKRIRKQLKNAELPYSESPFKWAIRNQSDSLDTYVIMIPFSNLTPECGSLETLLMPAAMSTLAIHVPCLEARCQCTEIARRSKSHADKARLRVLLAAANSDDPNIGLQFAVSSEKNLIPFSHECFNELSDLLKSLLT